MDTKNIRRGQSSRSHKTIPQRQERGERTALHIYPRTDTHHPTYWFQSTLPVHISYHVLTHHLPRIYEPALQGSLSRKFYIEIPSIHSCICRYLTFLQWLFFLPLPSVSSASERMTSSAYHSKYQDKAEPADGKLPLVTYKTSQTERTGIRLQTDSR